MAWAATASAQTGTGGSLERNDGMRIVIGWIVVTVLTLVPVALVGYVVWLVRNMARDLQAIRSELPGLRNGTGGAR